MSDRFVYVTYIRTTPEKLWDALLQPEFTRQYWAETTQESTWEKGAAWQIKMPGGEIADSGKVLEIEPHKGAWRIRARCWRSIRRAGWY